MKIISIGCNCDVGFFIKRICNKEYYPFDWIWSNIDFVINTFEKDHFEFTECEKLNFNCDTKSKHTYISNDIDEKMSSALSVHDADSQTKNEYLKNIPMINNKYKRRFKRLYDILNSNEEIILIRKVLDKKQNAIEKNYDSNEKLNYLSELLSKKFKANIKICVIDNENFIQKDYLNENIKLFRSFNELYFYLNNLYFKNVRTIANFQIRKLNFTFSKPVITAIYENNFVNK